MKYWTLLLLSGISALAQTPQIFPIFQNNKIGYINRQGVVILPAQFDKQSPAFLVPTLGEGLYALKKNGAVGYFNITGNAVIKPQFDWGEPFIDGYALVAKNDERGAYHWGMIDPKGSFIIKPRNRDLERHDGLLLARTYLPETQKYRYDLITLSDNVITSVELVEDYSEVAEAAKSIAMEFKLTFHEDLIPALAQGNYGFKDRQNNFVIKPRYEEAGCFSEGFAAVRSGGLWGFIDKSGESVIVPQFDSTHVAGFMHGHCFVKSRGRWRWIDRTGHFTGPSVFDDVKQEPFHEGMIGIKINGKWGFMDSTGTLTVTPQFMDVSHFSEGYGLVHEDRGSYFSYRKGHGFIDRKGKILLKPTRAYAGDFHDGWTYMVYTGSDGRDPFPIDKNFKEMVPDQRVNAAQDSLWVLQDSRYQDRYGLYSWKSRRYILEPKYLEMTVTGGDMIYVVLSKTDQDFEYAYIDFNGTIIFRATEKGDVVN